MLCPRCAEEVADQSAECPVCHKQLRPGDQSHTRTALTGEAFVRVDPAVDSPIATTAPHAEDADMECAKPPPAVPVRLIPTHPERFAAKKRPDLRARPRPVGPEYRWLVCGIAVVGAIASAILWFWPYVAPVPISLSAPGAGEVFASGGAARQIPSVYLWLWGCYGVLAVATQFLLPAPWRAGPMQMRTNWVLNISTIVAILIFLGAGQGELNDRYVFANHDGGTLEYHDGANVRGVTAEEAGRIAARLVHDQEAETFRQWNMAALLSYLALGAYCAWWLMVRPEAEPRETPQDDDWLVRSALGEADPPMASARRETVPREDTQTRDTTPGIVPWK